MTVITDPKTRTFNNMVFRHSGGKPRSKVEAQKLAKELHSFGLLARVVESKRFEGSWVVYVHGQSKDPFTGKRSRKMYSRKQIPGRK